jgi:ribonuclease HI
MVYLPPSIERRLQELFPQLEDRERFVAEALAQAMENLGVADAALPESVGGTLHLFTDGGSRGNPGTAAIGAILEDPVRGEVLKEHAEVIGTETNNVAEYRALIAGLKMAQAFRPNRLICHMDSELLVKQLNGEYQVKMHTLQPLFGEIQHLSQDFPDIVFQYIPREDNYRADALVNKALNEAGAPKRPLPPVQGTWQK